ncbi:16S rRNA (cytosine(1402)-N(4))-methyltransferase RsmH [Exiguobacterium aurantiacum]|uniref:Ribosomal RNA small subunit methyltransferase H n=1 Tax=Exiguobacterium aurantiacum TaxID=33987 RepID=A0A377FW65_9BACL|nr:16S rRNA (cytosine(1402)-N(4))-methyltransferase RsmH [Exiguobacterium aurantiacum]STO08553.1 Ribosomal RNA small subunit methyltransferase H [Exiguobacterium aurantiacum]
MFEHETVLKMESIEGLNIKPDGIYVDCTLGGAGHSEEIVKRLTTGHLYAFDQDDVALAHAKERLAPYEDRVTFIKSNFVHLKDELHARGVAQVDGVLFDLGVSSPQLDEAERGFSYNYDAPLDMRMDRSNPFSAYHVVNEWAFGDLARIFFTYGEEKFSKQIARKIEKARAEKPIETTFELVDLIKDAIPAPARRKGGHPAKRTFQAIRIAVNDELNVFDRAVQDAIDMLAINGRICVITFHSLEDRICKQVFKDKSQHPPLPPGLPVIPKEFEPELKLITRKPITAGGDELEDNRRARSAKLRVAEKQK